MSHDDCVSGDDWVPFGLDDKEASEYRVLVPGVPLWLKQSLVAWAFKYFESSHNLSSTQRLLAANRAVRIGLRTNSSSPYTSARATLEDLRGLDERQLLATVDWIVRQVGRGSTANDLAAMLTEASSKYKVGVRSGGPGLENRVAEGVQDAAEALIAHGGTAGKLLADAWQKVHRLDPDDSGAYADAVKAVEVASFEPLGIDNSRGDATLGQAIAKIRKDGSWRPPFEREHVHHPVHTTLVGMLRTLWVGHRDRHGKADFSAVSHQEAEAAVTLAVTLVGWFTSGAVQQRPDPEQFDR